MDIFGMKRKNTVCSLVKKINIIINHNSNAKIVLLLYNIANLA